MAHVSGGENEAQCVVVKIDALGRHEPTLHEPLVDIVSSHVGQHGHGCPTTRTSAASARSVGSRL
jgi:hypothetical protein